MKTNFRLCSRKKIGLQNSIATKLSEILFYVRKIWCEQVLVNNGLNSAKFNENLRN